LLAFAADAGAFAALAPAKCLSRRDGSRCRALPDCSGTERAKEGTKPCRARDIVTDRIRASSAAWAVIAPKLLAGITDSFK
jgi:hypothetical protein